MLGTFAYLTWCSFKNRVRRRVQRLREPRYLVGLVVGAIYFYFALLRPRAVSRRGRGIPGFGSAAGAVQSVASVVLFAIAALAWVWPGAGKPITFSRAEVQFLFTAPVTRRQLLHYRLIRSQLSMLLSSALITMVARPSTLANSWMSVAGLWLVFMTVRLHLIGVALSRTSLAQHGRSGVWRQWLPLAVVFGAVGVLVETAIQGWPDLVSAPDVRTAFLELQRLCSTGPAGVVLWPFHTLAALPLAQSPDQFASALPWVLLLIGLNYVWVLRSDAAFEEASAEHAERRGLETASATAVPRRSASAPFRLGLIGPPETAILWKNLILLGRYVSARTLLRLLPLVVALGLASQASGHVGLAVAVGGMCIWLGLMLMLMGPQMMRNDLRHDLANLALIKTWPVSGAAIVRGEVLAPAIVMSSVIWLLIVLGALLGQPLLARMGEPPTALEVLGYALSAAILAPPVVLSQTVVLNGIAVLFPAWSSVGTSRARGIDAMGQRLLMMAGLLVTLAISLVPGAAVAAAAMFAAYWMTGMVILVVPAVLFALVVLAECWMATELLGRVLDRTDVNAIEPVE
ncbi:MAG: putative ABC exporter domain-containing protein [Acidobacteriota bacterium]